MMEQHIYALLDFGDERRLEQWGPYRLIRPDPTAFGAPAHPELWSDADAVYEGEKGKGEWSARIAMPESWPVMFDDIVLRIQCAPYKHTGVFPEQQQNWQWMRKQAQARADKTPLRILNLFAYTGGATMALAKDGHFVTHVDSSKPTIGWAKENAALNDIPTDRIRWMLEDAPVFAAREVKRGKTYDAIILDPPAYGHGPTGKVWRADRDLAPLLEDCCTLLSEKPAFLLLNGYAQNDTPESFWRLLTAVLREKAPHVRADVDADELMLYATDERSLSTGITARCTFAR